MMVNYMWNKLRNHMFKLAALVAVISFLYPGVMTAREFLFDTGGNLLEFISALIAMVLGAGFAFVVYNKSHRLIRLIFTYFLAIIPAAAAIACFMDDDLGRAIYEAIVLVLFYINGVNSYLCYYNVIFNWKILYTGTVVLFICLLLASLSEKYMHMKGIFFTAAYVYILMSLVLKTQENLDLVFRKRGVEASEIQKKIRKSNMVTVLAFYSIILVLFNIKNIIVFILETARRLGGQLMDFLIYLLKLLFRHKAARPYQDSFGFIPLDPVPAWRPIVVLIFSIVVHFFILFALYKLIPPLYKYLKKQIERFVGFLHKIIKGRVCFDTPDENECTEIVEVEKVIIDKKARVIKNNFLARLAKTSDPVEKIRLMYKITISSMVGKGVQITSSDTTGEIIAKSGRIDGVGTKFSVLTKIYEDIRYGEVSPSEEVLVSARQEFDDTQKMMLDRRIKI
jgi:hypothetical protein